MIDVWLYDDQGEELGKIEAEEGGAIPRKGEELRITEGELSGDYIVEFVRWRIPAADVQLGVRPRASINTWPGMEETEEDFSPDDIEGEPEDA